MNLHDINKTSVTQDLYVALGAWSRKVGLVSSAWKRGICEVVTGDCEDLFSDTV
jgi:hypothetical protein